MFGSHIFVGAEMNIEWMVVQDSWTGKKIGAVGFMGDEIATIVAFYEDKDADEDGKVSKKEKVFQFFSMKGKSLTKVAAHAYANPDILMRDPSIAKWRGDLLTKFARGLWVEGVYKAWFAMGISAVAGGVASGITKSAIKSFVIKKTLEKTVEAAYKKRMVP